MKRNYIVTGSSDGLGLALAKKLLVEGHTVFGISRRGNSELNLNSNFFNFKVDIADYTRVKEIFNEIIGSNREINGVVHAAAVSGPLGKIENTLLSEWIHAININLIGSYNLISICAKYFRERKIGSFIAISGGGASSPMPRMTAYAASKTGLVRLIESVARDFDDLPNVTFNAIAPGVMKTKMIDEVIAAGPDIVGKDYYLRMLEFRENGEDSTSNAIKLIDFLISNDGHKISGKLISAIWDPWADNFMNPEYSKNHEIHTLRRSLFKETN